MQRFAANPKFRSEKQRVADQTPEKFMDPGAVKVGLSGRGSSSGTSLSSRSRMGQCE